jgi:RNA polymerase sigma-70 factor (ECF subfamily)
VLDDDVSCRAAYQAHGAELYRLCLRGLGDRGQAEDAVQEVFVRAWRNGDRYDPAVASLRTWLFAIARNVVVDAQRARSVRPVLVEQDVARSPAVADHAEQVLWRLRLRDELSRLSPDQRGAVEQIAVLGRSSREVAAELGMSESTVRSRLFYGLRRLRVAMQEEGQPRAG